MSCPIAFATDEKCTLSLRIATVSTAHTRALGAWGHTKGPFYGTIWASCVWSRCDWGHRNGLLDTPDWAQTQWFQCVEKLRQVPWPAGGPEL